MRISDWSSDVCSSDLPHADGASRETAGRPLVAGRYSVGQVRPRQGESGDAADRKGGGDGRIQRPALCRVSLQRVLRRSRVPAGSTGLGRGGGAARRRSEEHTSELQSLMRISYAVFCLKKKTYTK